MAMRHAKVLALGLLDKQNRCSWQVVVVVVVVVNTTSLGSVRAGRIRRSGLDAKTYGCLLK